MNDEYKISEKNYKVFLDNYKNIEFSIACLESEKDKWEIIPLLRHGGFKLVNSSTIMALKEVE